MKKIVRQSLIFLIPGLIQLLTTQFATAHGTGSRMLTDNKTVTAEFYYSDGEPMSYAEVLVFSPEDEKTEYQNGRTDRKGRFAFCPDTPGTWRIEASDGMGHKAVAGAEVQEEKTGETAAEKKSGKNISVQNAQSGTSSMLLKSVAGLSLIFNLFFVFFLRKRKN
ncbi:MAG: hypothetical protein AB7S75_05770 [Desulfococcaceae bacterium]